MRSYRGTTHCGISLMGFDFYATIDFKFYPGSPATWCKRIGTWDPPDPPEWEVEAIWLELDEPGKDAPKWKLTGAMLNLIAEHDAVVLAVQTADQNDVPEIDYIREGDQFGMGA